MVVPVQFSKIEQEIKSGDLLAFSHFGWSTLYDWEVQMVRLFTRSEYSHVGLAIVQEGKVMCLEAVPPKVRLKPLNEEGDFYWMPLSVNWTTEVDQYARSTIGMAYSKWQAILSLFEVPPVDNKWQCAEHVRAILERAGLRLDPPVTPSSIIRDVQKYGYPMWLVNNSVQD